jgi:uncharacterized SAM-binding protein YcdF (DUF218 family)
MIKTVLRRVARVESNLNKRKLMLLLFTALLVAACTVYNLMHVALRSRRNSNEVNEAKQLTALLLGEDDARLLQGYDSDQEKISTIVMTMTIVCTTICVP